MRLPRLAGRAALGDQSGLDALGDLHGLLVGGARERLGVVHGVGLVHDAQRRDRDGLLQQPDEGRGVGGLLGAAAEHLADQRVLPVDAAGDLAAGAVHRPGVDEVRRRVRGQ